MRNLDGKNLEEIRVAMTFSFKFKILPFQIKQYSTTP
jgi:hypothetical protein